MTALTLIPLNISADQDRGAWIDSSIQAAVELSIGDIVYLDSSNLLRKAIADSAAHARVYGMVVGGVNTPYGETTIAANDYPSVCVAGNVFIPGALISSTAPAAGQFFYLSKDAAGGLVDTAPTGAYQVIVARAEGASALYIMPGISSPVSA